MRTRSTLDTPVGITATDPNPTVTGNVSTPEAHGKDVNLSCQLSDRKTSRKLRFGVPFIAAVGQ